MLFFFLSDAPSSTEPSFHGRPLTHFGPVTTMSVSLDCRLGRRRRHHVANDAAMALPSVLTAPVSHSVPLAPVPAKNHQGMEQPSSFSRGGQHNRHFCVKDLQTDIHLLFFLFVFLECSSTTSAPTLSRSSKTSITRPLVPSSSSAA